MKKKKLRRKIKRKTRGSSSDIATLRGMNPEQRANGDFAVRCATARGSNPRRLSPSRFAHHFRSNTSCAPGMAVVSPDKTQHD